MRASEDRNIEYQDRTGGLCLTANIYPKSCRIEKKASDKNLVIIILDGDGIVSIPGFDRCRAGKGKLVFIPANMGSGNTQSGTNLGNTIRRSQ